MHNDVKDYLIKRTDGAGRGKAGPRAELLWESGTSGCVHVHPLCHSFHTVFYTSSDLSSQKNYDRVLLMQTKKILYNSSFLNHTSWWEKWCTCVLAGDGGQLCLQTIASQFLLDRFKTPKSPHIIQSNNIKHISSNLRISMTSTFSDLLINRTV